MKPKAQKNSDKPNESYKYIDLGWRMLAIVGASVAAGYFLNKKFPQTHPLFLVILPLLGLGISMYMLIKAGSIKKKN